MPIVFIQNIYLRYSTNNSKIIIGVKFKFLIHFVPLRQAALYIAV